MSLREVQEGQAQSLKPKKIKPKEELKKDTGVVRRIFNKPQPTTPTPPEPTSTPVTLTQIEEKVITSGSPQGGQLGKALVEQRVGGTISVQRNTTTPPTPRPPRGTTPYNPVNYQQQKQIDYTEWARNEYKGRDIYDTILHAAPAAVIAGAFNPEFYWKQITTGRGYEVINKWEYEATHQIRSGDVKGYAWNIATSPGMTNIVYPAITMGTIGLGLGVVTKAAPAIGTVAKVALTGYGTYAIGKSTIEPAFKKDWNTLGLNVTTIGMQLPFMALGFTSGYNYASKLNIPTYTTRGIPTLEKINTNFVVPTRTTLNKINPSNLLVRWKAKQLTDITSPRVESGASRFPTSPNVAKTLDYFEKGYDPFTGKYETVHARAYPMRGDTIPSTPPTRTTDVSGLYVSSKGEGSAYFLRQGSLVPDYSYTTMDLSILPKKPSYRTFFVDTISRAPKGIRTNIENFKDWQMKTEPRSTATITPAHEMGIKAEIEAVIPPRASYKNILEPTGIVQRIKGYGEYTTYMGRDIPVYKYEVLGEGRGSVKETARLFKQVKNDYGYYSGSKSIISPSIVSLSGFTSIAKRGSFIPNTSGVSSSLISKSIISSIKSLTSKSYVPSTTPSRSATYSTPPYKPPYYSTTTYSPPYSPPYYPTTTYSPPYSPPYRPPYYPPREPPYVPPYYPRGQSGDYYNKKGSSSGYDVYVKERSYSHGKKRYPEAWKKANTSPLSENAALSLGGTAIDQSAAASFKIRPAEGNARPLKFPVDPWGSINSKFYKKKGIYIETTSNRIDTTGEIKGISALGWIASRQRAYKPITIPRQPKQTKMIVQPSYKPFDINQYMRGLKI